MYANGAPSTAGIRRRAIQLSPIDRAGEVTMSTADGVSLG